MPGREKTHAAGAEAKKQDLHEKYRRLAIPALVAAVMAKEKPRQAGSAEAGRRTARLRPSLHREG